MTPRRLALFVLATIALGASLPAFAQDAERTVEVIDLSGALDGRIIDFAIEAIEAAADAGVEVVILQVDSPGVIGGEDRLRMLIDLVASPPVPVVAWVGPSPARAHGGAGQIVLAADRAFAAPQSEIGFLLPTIAGASAGGASPLVDVPDVRLLDESLPVEEVPGIEVSPQTAAPRQVAQELDGRMAARAGGEVRLTTVRPFVAPDGSEGVSVLPTTIREPNLWDQFLRLAASPEAAFFFLVAGLTVAAFEFYAIGPGLAAGVAGVSLFLAAYGIATLPVRWWAVALSVFAVWVCAVGYQRGGIGALSVLGLALLPVAGFLFTDAAPQIRPGAAGVIVTVAAAAFFFLVAMPTVARSRFSTQTIGREGLIGEKGVAVTALVPDGEVEVNGAHWRATSHREAGIGPGDAIEVVAVEGWYLEVEPVRGG
ncbi:MAG TPA: NfeD family protein [Acidimicrobiia bacterium]